MEDRVIIEKILDHVQVGAGQDILDVACGEGLLFPYYLERNVASVTGVDIRAERVKLAREKFSEDARVLVLCKDVMEMGFRRKFDRIVVYNALPEFTNPKHLIRVLAGMLNENGRLTIAHETSKESAELMEIGKLKKLFDPRFQVEVMISDNTLYQVSGVRKDPIADVREIEQEDPQPVQKESATPMEELLVLMRYLVSHNDAHAQEIADLASELRTAGKFKAYRQIMDTVAEFDIVNAKLDAVLKNLQVEVF